MEFGIRRGGTNGGAESTSGWEFSIELTLKKFFLFDGTRGLIQSFMLARQALYLVDMSLTPSALVIYAQADLTMTLLL
jgi:hypothetical protein